MDPYTITLDGPRRNALTQRLLDDISRGLDAAGEQPVVLRGANGAFSSGLDLVELGGLEAPRLRRFLAALETLAERLFTWPHPTGAVVDGHAVAGGCLLVQCCDIRVASDDAQLRIGMPALALGMRYPPSLLAILCARLPARHRETVLLGARIHDPKTAVRLGLLDGTAGEPASAVRAELAHRAGLSRDAYASTKRALRAPLIAESARTRDAFYEALMVRWAEPSFAARLRSQIERSR